MQKIATQPIPIIGAQAMRRFAYRMAQRLSAPRWDRGSPRPAGAMVIALEGDLGAGKTTFTQGFARALGIRDRVLSPTFVLMKIYALHKKRFRHLAHIDCYRIASPRDLLHLGLREMLKDKDAIILIEWPERIKKILPADTVWLRFAHGNKLRERIMRVHI